MKISTEVSSIAKKVGMEKAVELCANAGFDAWDFSMFDMHKLAARPVIKAKKLLLQAENYTKLEEIESLYEEAKARHEKSIEDARLEAERAEAEKKAHAEKLKTKK